jgi:hypothetical protein
MLNTFSFNKFPDGVSGTGKKLLGGKKNSLVEVKKTVLNIMPQKMEVYFMGVGRLAAIVAEMTFKMLAAVFTGSGHITWY